MAKYYIKKAADGTYSIMGLLLSGREIAAREAVNKVPASELGVAAEQIANTLFTTREKLSLARGDTSIGGNVR